MSSEPIDETVDVTNDNRIATLTVGTHTLNAPVALIEMTMVMINQHLQGKTGYGWLSIGGKGTDVETEIFVLVSRSTPISVRWPAGFEPFEKPNSLVDAVRENPVADLPDDDE